MDESNPIPSKPKKRVKYRKGLSAKSLDFNKIQKRLLNALARDTDQLLIASYTRKLDKDEGSDLRGYIKLIRDLLQDKKADKKDITDDRLEKFLGKDSSQK